MNTSKDAANAGDCEVRPANSAANSDTRKLLERQWPRVEVLDKWLDFDRGMLTDWFSVETLLIGINYRIRGKIAACFVKACVAGRKPDVWTSDRPYPSAKSWSAIPRASSSVSLETFLKKYIKSDNSILLKKFTTQVKIWKAVTQ